MKFKLDRIISLATLIAAVVAIVLVLKRPSPVEQPQQAAVPAAANAQAFEQKPSPSEPGLPQAQPQQGYPQVQPANASAMQPLAAGSPTQQAAALATQGSKAEAGSDGISAMIAQSLGAAAGGLSNLSPSNLSPDANLGSGSPNIKDQQVTMEGDVVHGRFLTEIGGKEVWVTVSGHMGEKDGFATFDPTEFKVGDVDVPVSLVNPMLQKKMAEERDRLKVPASQ
jgi:hypothetical protein